MVDGSEILHRSYGKYPIYYLQGFLHVRVVAWDFFTINRYLLDPRCHRGYVGFVTRKP